MRVSESVPVPVEEKRSIPRCFARVSVQSFGVPIPDIGPAIAFSISVRLALALTLIPIPLGFPTVSGKVLPA